MLLVEGLSPSKIMSKLDMVTVDSHHLISKMVAPVSPSITTTVVDSSSSNYTH